MRQRSSARSRGPVVAALLLIGACVWPLSSYAAPRQPATRTATFQATYTGTLLIGKTPFVSTRTGRGTASTLGRSSLVSSDRAVHMFRNDPQAKCLAVIGEGALRIASGDQVKFLYLLGACGLYPGLRYAPSGHYIIYGGSGKFAGAHGRGTFRETGILNLGAPGDASPITDTFSGTLTLPAR